MGKIAVYGFGGYVLFVLLFLMAMATVSLFLGKFSEFWSALMSV